MRNVSATLPRSGTFMGKLYTVAQPSSSADATTVANIERKPRITLGSPIPAETVRAVQSQLIAGTYVGGQRDDIAVQFDPARWLM